MGGRGYIKFFGLIPPPPGLWAAGLKTIACSSRTPFPGVCSGGPPAGDAQLMRQRVPGLSGCLRIRIQLPFRTWPRR